MNADTHFDLKQGLAFLFAAVASTVAGTAGAALPEPVLPPDTPANSADMIAVGQSFFQQGSEALMLVFGVVLFLVAAIAVVYKFIQWRQDRAELSDLGTVALVGAGVVVMDLYMLSQATGILE